MRDSADANGWANPSSLVVDLGTCTTRVGSSTSPRPEMLLPSLVGRGRHAGAMQTLGLRNEYVGHEALGLRGILDVKPVIRQGQTTNWSDLELLCSHLLSHQQTLNDGLKVNEMQVLVSVPPFFSDHSKLAELLLHKLGVKAVYMANKAVLAMYGGGRTTGVCVDMGDDSVYVVPCWEGSPIPNATVVQRLGGRHVTDRLMSLLINQGKYSFPDDTFLLLKSRNSKTLTIASKRDVVNEAKERFCKVAPYNANKMGNNAKGVEEQVLRLPDGNMVVVGKEALEAPELLFNPSLSKSSASKTMVGLHDLVWQSVMRCQAHLRARLLSNIMLTGGNALLPGLAQRLQAELAAMLFRAGDNRVFGNTNSNAVIRVNALEDREHFTWTGGAHLCSLASFQRLWITKRDYDEKGLETEKENDAFIDVASNEVPVDT